MSGPTSPWWVVNNGDDSSALYTGAGARAGNNLLVSVPGGPTGIVFNSTTNFKLPTTGTPAARFIFATEGGEIFGWAGGTAATSVVPPSPMAIYKGLAINAAGDRIYATNFKAGTVDTYDAIWQPILAGKFADWTLPEGIPRSASRSSALPSTSPTRCRTKTRKTTSLAWATAS